MTTNRLLTARWYALFAVGVAAFILYGSYVPFDYAPLPWDEATEAFGRTVRATLRPSSRSDWMANWCLGVPLGFCLLGAARVDRTGRAATLAFAAVVVPACLAFAAGVEFGQLFFPGRECSGSDIWAQALGAACGVAAWLAGGQQWTVGLRRALGKAEGTGRLLTLYAFCALVAQTLPFDLTASPSELYRRVRVQEITVVPLGELAARPGVSAEQDWKKVAAWCELLAMAIPGGVLLAGLGGRWKSVNTLPATFAAALVAGSVLELAQWPVKSRHPSTTDVLILAFGVMLGWGIALAVADKGSRKHRPTAAALLGQAWVAVLALHHWQPFHFLPPVLTTNAARMTFLPFEQQIGKAYLWGLEEMVQKVWLFVPLGAVAGWGWKRAPDRRAVAYAVCVCVFAAAVLEFGQLLLPARVGSPTDLLFAAAGGWLGAVVTRRRLAASTSRPFVPRTATGPRWVPSAAPVVAAGRASA